MTLEEQLDAITTGDLVEATFETSKETMTRQGEVIVSDKLISFSTSLFIIRHAAGHPAKGLKSITTMTRPEPAPMSYVVLNSGLVAQRLDDGTRENRWLMTANSLRFTWAEIAKDVLVIYPPKSKPIEKKR